MAQIKDILQMHVLAVHGGSFVDLDVLWLGRKFPQCGTEPGLPRVVLHTEPDKKFAMSRLKSVVYDGSTPGTPRGAFSLSVMYAEPGTPEMHDVAVHLEQFWDSSVARGRVESHPWMVATTEVQTVLGVPLDKLHLVSVSPMAWCPLPRWLKTWTIDRVTESYGCEVPGGEAIAAVSVSINVWSRQWPSCLQKQVVEWARALLQGRLALSPQLFGIPDVYRNRRNLLHTLLCRMAGPLTSFCLDPPTALNALADAHNALGNQGELDLVRLTAGQPAEASVALITVCLQKRGAKVGVAMHIGLCSVVGANADRATLLVESVRTYCCIASFAGPRDVVQNCPIVLCQAGL